MFKVCIDIGGTFTDCVILDGKNNLTEFKTLSTPPDFSKGLLNTLEEAAQAVFTSNNSNMAGSI